MGYKQPTIRLDFADLVDDGEECYVTIRNPKLLPPSMLTPEDVPTGPDGKPLDITAAEESTFKMLAGLIVDWRVWDCTDYTEDSPLLGEKTAENVAKLPIEIIGRISEEVEAAIPSHSTP